MPLASIGDMLTICGDPLPVSETVYIAFRLAWDDPTPDLHAGKVEAFKDAVALELVPGTDEPFLGMGSTTTPIDLWTWDADRGQAGDDLEDVGGVGNAQCVGLAEVEVDRDSHR